MLRRSWSENPIYDSVFEIVKFSTRDLSLVYTKSEKGNFYSFLNFAWGFIADVDIESEKYRAIGDVRFTLGCLVRTFNLRKYQGTLSYIPDHDSHIWKIFEKKHVCKHKVVASLQESSEEDESQLETRHREKNERHVDTTVNARSLPMVEADSANPTTSDLSCPPYLQHEQITNSLSNDWQYLEGEFVWVSAIYLSHLGKDMFMMPHAKCGGDTIYLYCLKSTVSRARLLQVLLSIKDGNHLELVEQDTLVIPCKAFRLEPLSKHTGYMAVDGELVPYGPVQASVTAIKAKVICSVGNDSVV
ncbi:unnamed protein product [Clavelina lepadiformis]|uniref:Sphingosine kinase 1 n=1 Tax=Clavelina lepadiformis TaxID=159417 RepID=A0ABP0GZZ1_CLALP